MIIDVLKTIIHTLGTNDLQTIDLLSSVKIGDILHVQVVKVSNQNVILRLPNGTNVLAESMVPLNSMVGNFVNVRIKDKQEGRIFVEVLKNGEVPKDLISTQVSSILNSHKLPANELNTRIVKEMLEQGVSVTKQNIQLILNNIIKYSDIDVPKAVFMIANSIPFEKSNIKLLNQYVKGMSDLIKKLNLLMNHPFFKKHFVDVNSETLSENLNVSQFYKSILNKISILKNLLQDDVNRNEELLNLITDIEKSIKFIDNLNQSIIFIPVPINILENGGDAELYLLKDKKKRKVDFNNTNLFLFLNLPNLGLIEAVINIKDKNIICKFRVESENVISFIKKHSSKLMNTLDEKGYKILSINYELVKKKTDIIEISKILKNFPYRKTYFDVKV